MDMHWEEYQNALHVLEQSNFILNVSPVYNKYTGNFICPGYKEGESFVKCDTSYTREELPRIKDWNNNFQRR